MCTLDVGISKHPMTKKEAFSILAQLIIRLQFLAVPCCSLPLEIFSHMPNLHASPPATVPHLPGVVTATTKGLP